MLLTRRLALFEPARRVAPAWLRRRLRGTREVVRRLNADVTAAPTRQPTPVELRDRLRAEMRPDVERLSELLGRDMAAYWWG